MDATILKTRLSRREILKSAGLLGASLMTASLGVNRAMSLPAPTAPASHYGASVAVAWFRLALRLVEQTPGFSPPVAARAFGYIGVTLYEAVLPGMPGYRSLAGQLNALSPYPPPHDHVHHWPTVANAAMATITRSLFPTASEVNRTAIDELESTLSEMVTSDVPTGIIKRSQQRGRAVAAHIFDWSKSDGGHEGFLRNFSIDYDPPVGPGLWIPTPPGFQPALQPFWGQNRPFVLESGADGDPGPPPVYSAEPGTLFHDEALEVYEVVNTLTEEQRAIAVFWADDPGQTPTPPGHSISILNQVLDVREADLATAAEAYARVGVAISDAFVCCWHSKYTYNLIRPISYIHQGIDSGWGVNERALPVTTPPFPEYTSGHSAQTGAFAQVMFDMFGDVPLTDYTHDERGLASRSFTSWFELAEETAISRLYGGIHFRAAIEIGLEQGKHIGHEVRKLTLGRAG